MIYMYIFLAIAMFIVIRFCRKKSRIILIILIAVATIYCIMLSVEIHKISEFKEPVFAVEKYKDNDVIEQTTIYKGIGYRIKIVRSLKEDTTLEIAMYIGNKCIAAAIQ